MDLRGTLRWIICACLPTLRPLVRALCCDMHWSSKESEGAPGPNYRMRRLSSYPRPALAQDTLWSQDGLHDEYPLTTMDTKSGTAVPGG